MMTWCKNPNPSLSYIYCVHLYFQMYSCLFLLLFKNFTLCVFVSSIKITLFSVKLTLNISDLKQKTFSIGLVRFQCLHFSLTKPNCGFPISRAFCLKMELTKTHNFRLSPRTNNYRVILCIELYCAAVPNMCRCALLFIFEYSTPCVFVSSIKSTLSSVQFTLSNLNPKRYLLPSNLFRFQGLVSLDNFNLKSFRLKFGTHKNTHFQAVSLTQTSLYIFVRVPKRHAFFVYVHQCIHV